jgi:hypothetical protein
MIPLQRLGIKSEILTEKGEEDLQPGIKKIYARALAPYDQ